MTERSDGISLRDVHIDALTLKLRTGLGTKRESLGLEGRTVDTSLSPLERSLANFAFLEEVYEEFSPFFREWMGRRLFGDIKVFKHGIWLFENPTKVYIHENGVGLWVGADFEGNELVDRCEPGEMHTWARDNQRLGFINKFGAQTQEALLKRIEHKVK